MGRQIHTAVAALEAVFHLRTRKLVQHHLHHGELVEIGIEQAGDDHGVSGLALGPADSVMMRSDRQAGPTHPGPQSGNAPG